MGFFPLKRPFPLRPSFRVSQVTQNKTKEEQSEDMTEERRCEAFGGAMRKMRVVIMAGGWGLHFLHTLKQKKKYFLKITLVYKQSINPVRLGTN